MRWLRNLGLAVLALAIPITASAQVDDYYDAPPAPTPFPGLSGAYTDHGNKGGYVYSSIYINSSYLGEFGGDRFDMYCIDPHNNPRNGNIYVTPLYAAGTWGGVNPGQYTYLADKTKYLQAAWLASQFDTSPPNDLGNAQIQGAIWKIMGGANWDDEVDMYWNLTAGNALITGIDAWVTSAQMASNYNSVNQNRYAVLSSVAGVTRSQEFLVEVQGVPEPASMLLLFTGLIGVAGVARRRRQDHEA